MYEITSLSGSTPVLLTGEQTSIESSSSLGEALRVLDASPASSAVASNATSLARFGPLIASLQVPAENQVPRNKSQI